MIAPDSKSFPVLGAARWACVPYRSALAVAEALRRDDWQALSKSMQAVREEHGSSVASAIYAALVKAIEEGRIYAHS